MRFGRPIRLTAIWVVVLVAALVLAACGDGDSDDDGDLTEVVFRTDFRFNGYVTPFALALEKGYYRDAGLDVKIEQGQGSATTVQTVGTGRDDIGLADSATAVIAASNEDVPIKILGVYLQRTPLGFIFKPGSGFQGPEDLVDRPVISSPGSNELIVLPALLSEAGLDRDELDLRLVDLNARISTFLQTDDSVLMGFASGDFLRAQTEDPSVEFRSFADYGLQVYATGLIASNEMVEDDPDTLRAFVEASTQGWQDAQEDPEAAVDAGMELFPDSDRQFLAEGLNQTLSQFLHTTATEGEPPGLTAESDWEDMLEVLGTTALDEVREPGDYYTNEFIPGGDGG